MTAPLSDTVVLTITQDSVGLARAAFGVPMVLSHNAAFSERVRTYSSLLEVADDFAAGTPEYLAANSLFAQSPHPTSLKIGRAALKPTLQYTLAATAANTTDYDLTVSGPSITETEVTYTSDSAATVAEIHSGLVTALNAVTGNTYIADFEVLVYADDTFTAVNGTEIFTNVAHGLLTGDGPFQVSNSGGALPAGLSAVTDYWVIKIDADTFYLATSLANALSGAFLLISTNGTGTQTISDTASTRRPSEPITITGDAAGTWFSLAVDNLSRLQAAMVHTDPGLATDLAAISVEDDDWYALIYPYGSQACIEAIAAYIEAVRKIYIADTCDGYSANVAYGAGDDDDALAAIHSDELSRTAGIFHPDPSDMAAAAWVGAVLPYDPGSATWKFKTLAGVAPVSLTSTQRTNLRNRKGNSYETVGGANKTWEGTTGDGDFIDITQGIDWIYDDMTKGVYEALSATPKVSFDDDGIALIESEIRGTLQTAVDMSILSDNPAPIVTAPRASAVSAVNKAIRNLTGVKWSATLDGAIHKVNITGVVSV